MLATEVRPRLEALTGLRYVAALLVLCGHMLAHIAGHTGDWTICGIPVPHLPRLGMSLFFTLSGFLMYYNYFDQFLADFRGTLRRFYVARVARIYPLYLFALVLSFSFMGCFFHDLRERTFETLYCLGIDLTLTQAWFYDLVFQDYQNPRSLAVAYLGVSWSVSVEIFFYLTFPFVCVPLVRRLPTIGWLLGAAAVVLVAYMAIDLALAWPLRGTDIVTRPEWSDSLIRWQLYLSPYGRYGEFVLGCLVGRVHALFASRPVSAGERRWGAGILWGAVTLALAFTFVPRGMEGNFAFVWNAFKMNVGYAPFCLVLLLCLSRYSSPLQWLLSRPKLILLGEASYGIYLLHPLVMSFYHERTRGEGDYQQPSTVLFNVAAMMVVLHIFSLGSYRYIECPWRERIKAWLSPRNSPPPAILPLPTGESHRPRSRIPA